MLPDSVFDADSNAVECLSLASHVVEIIGLKIAIFHNFGHFDIIFIAQPCETTKTDTDPKILLFHSGSVRYCTCVNRFQKKVV